MKSIIEIKVRGYHADQFKHVNNARYLEFLAEARWTFEEDNGLFEKFKTNGIKHATVNININYRKSALVGDLLKIETDLMKKGGRSITFQQVVFLNGTNTLIADAEVTNVYLYQESNKVIPIDDVFISLWPELKDL